MPEFPAPAARTAVAAARAGDESSHGITTAWSVPEGLAVVAEIRAIAETGADLVSVGELTHSAPALDLTMRVTADPVPCPR
ncbi:hypothetical protein [Nocardiopsis oceani]